MPALDKTLAGAKAYALAVGMELERNKPLKEIQHLAVCVTNETGMEIFRTEVANLQQLSYAEEMVPGSTWQFRLTPNETGQASSSFL
jgi:hypothetical protein